MKPIALLAFMLTMLPPALRTAPLDKKTTVLRKRPYRFEVVTEARVGEWFGWWGAPETGRVGVITAMRGFRGKQRLSLPPSAVAGLADPHEFTLRQAKRGMELKIVGSDAGGAWVGTFLFNGPGILERTIRDAEFPELDYERTTYRYIQDGEVN